MTRTEFFEALANGAKWNVGVSIARTNPLPLDANSVFQSVADLETYVKTNPLAYPGQLVSVIGETDLSAYHVTSVGESGTYVKLAASTASGDLAADVAALQGQVSTLIKDLDALEAIVGADAASGLRRLVADNTAAIDAVEGRLDTLEGSDAVEGSVARKIKDAIAEYKTADDAALKTVDDKVIALTTKVGTVPEDKTVVRMIADAQAAATYDDTELAGRVTTVEGKVTTLIGDDANKSARAIASEEVAKIVAGADTAYDTLKEIADWISSHKTDATAMNSAITALEGIVDGIGGEGEKATVVEYVTDAIAALKIGDYAKAADLTALADKVTTLEGSAHTHSNKDLLDTYTQTEADLADAVAKKHEHTNADVLAGITEEKVTAWDAAEQNAKNYADSKVATVQSSVDTLSGKVTALENVGAQANVIESIKVNGTVQSVTDKVVDISVPTKLSQLEGYSNLTAEVAKKVDVVDGKSLVDDELVTKLSNLANIKTVSSELSISDTGELSIAAVAASKVTGLEALIQEIHSPIATNVLAGLVMANPVENGIDVATDGKMSVHSVNVTKLVQTEGDELILNGGNAGASVSE